MRALSFRNAHNIFNNSAADTSRVLLLFVRFVIIVILQWTDEHVGVKNNIYIYCNERRTRVLIIICRARIYILWRAYYTRTLRRKLSNEFSISHYLSERRNAQRRRDPWRLRTRRILIFSSNVCCSRTYSSSLTRSRKFSFFFFFDDSSLYIVQIL